MKNRIFSPAKLLLLLPVMFLAACHKEDVSDPYTNQGNLVFTGDANVKQLVPASTDTSTGTASFYGVYDANSKIFNYKLSWTNMEANVDTANFYGPALPGQVGVITRNIFNQAVTATYLPTYTGYSNVIWMYSQLTDAELADLKAGKWYYTLSTTNVSGPTVRGQITYQKTF